MAGYPNASIGGGQLTIIQHCSLYIPNTMNNNPIYFQGMPSVSDGKSAKYDPTPVIGRATELLTYANSSMRTISVDLPFFVTKTSGTDYTINGVGTVQYNISALRAIASATYPRSSELGLGVTYLPPPICVFQFGSFLATSNLCVIIDKYSVKNDPAVPSDPVTLCPYKFTVNVSMIKAYSSIDLPNQSTIWSTGV